MMLPSKSELQRRYEAARLAFFVMNVVITVGFLVLAFFVNASALAAYIGGFAFGGLFTGYAMLIDRYKQEMKSHG